MLLLLFLKKTPLFNADEKQLTQTKLEDNKLLYFCRFKYPYK